MKTIDIGNANLWYLALIWFKIQVKDLSLNDKININGGSLIAGGILIVALFMAGYQLGKDYAKKWLIMEKIQNKTASILVWGSLVSLGLFMAGYQLAKYYK